MSFKKPVEVGSILLFTSSVTYCPGHPMTTFQVSVQADVIDPFGGSRDTTNVFHFTFMQTKRPLPRVMPRTYAESMQLLEAKRRLERSP